MKQLIIKKAFKINILLIFIIITSQLIASPPPTDYIFNNGRMRIGNGSQHSINGYGNLLQPFYWDGSAFYKLTYSSYPLDIQWAIGGDGTNDWNTNGTSAYNPTWSNQTFDYSGFTITNAGTGEGYGTIITTGNITIDGKLFLVKNTYTLPQSDGFMAINVKLTNLSGATVDNIRLWVGTRDDYIAPHDDSPTKRRGNIVDGVFEQITNSADQAKAVKIYGDNLADDGAVMFYSNSDRAETLIHTHYNWSQVTALNPRTNYTHINNDDGNYAMYVRFNDLANNASDELTWYYAAGTLSEIDDIVAAVAAAAASADYDVADIEYTSSESGTAYTILVPEGSTAPTAEQVKAGIDYAGVTVVRDSSMVVTAGSDTTFVFTGLHYNTCFDSYTVTEWDNGGTLEFTTVIKTSFCTLDNDTPVGSSISNQNTCFNTTITGLSLSITDEYPGDRTFTVTGESSNTSIVENSGITITGTDTSRLISVMPKAGGASGTCTITLTIKDSEDYASTVTFDVTVYNDFQPGMIATTGETICAGGDPSTIGSSISAGGGDLSITYKWESSTDGFATPGTAIPLATGNTYNPPAGLGVTTSYRRYAHDGSCNPNFEASTGTWTVTVTASVTAITQDVTIYLNNSGNAYTSATAVDNGSTSCNGIASRSLSKTTFTCADVGDNEVTLTVTDNFGNTATATAIVTVVDNINPTVFTKNITVYLDAEGMVVITPAMIDNGSYDNCEIDHILLSKTRFNCSNIGTNQVMLIVTDKNGNVSTATANVTVRDNTPPQLSLVGTITIQRVDGHYVKFNIQELVDLVMDNADACGAANLSWAIVKASSDEPEDARGNFDGSTVNDIVISDDGQDIEVRAEANIRGNGRVYTIYIKATDAAGNSTQRSMLITVNARGRYTATDDGAAYTVFPGAPLGQVPVLVQTLLDQNTPNPFKTKTLIKFSLENDEYTSLAVYDMTGQLIKTLVSEVKLAGEHTIEWKADDNNGERVPPGMYIYVFKTNETQFSKKMLLLK